MNAFSHSLSRRFWNTVSSVTVGVKILGLALGLVLLLGAGVTWQARNSLSFILQQQMEKEGVTSTRDLAARAVDPILLNDVVGLQKLLLETQENNPDVRYAFILDQHGQVLAHTFGAGFPIGLINANQARSDDHHHTLVLQTEAGLVWDTAVPVFGGRAGMARLGLSDASLRSAIQTLTVQMLLMVLLVSAVGILVAVFLTSILTRPLRELLTATQVVARGDFSPRVLRWADDEIGDLADAFNAMTAELAHIDEIRREREQLRRQLLEKVIATQEDERRRIARELHDSTSQNLTSLMVGLKNIENMCDQQQMRAPLQELRFVVSQTLDEVHEISVRLRPPVLDDLGLSDAIERLGREWQARYKIPVDILVHLGSERLPGEIETAIYRIVQESLTNIARYACAKSASVLLERRGGDVVAIVEDDGQGFDIAQKFNNRQMGLAGMRERAELLNGNLTIESRPGQGVSIHVQIPITEEEKKIL
jgi:signal transduction histidine kinase